MAIIERLGASADGSSKKTLVIPRCFAVATQPLHEAAQNTRNCVHGLGLPGRAPSMFVVHFQFVLLWNSSYDPGGGTARGRGLGCCVGEAAGIGVRVMAGVGVTTCDG